MAMGILTPSTEMIFNSFTSIVIGLMIIKKLQKYLEIASEEVIPKKKKMKR